jgi:hypothetical protein
MRHLLRTLGVLSVLELVSIAVLFANLISFHLRPVTVAIGPIHGALYLTVIVTALFGRDLRLRTRLCALVPLLGGVLTLINIRTEHVRLRAR